MNVVNTSSCRMCLVTFFTLMVLSPMVSRASESVLLWMVDDNYEDPQIPDTSPDDLKYIDELLSRPDGYKVNGARLRVEGTDVYLNFFASGDDTPKNVLPIVVDPQEGCFTQAGPVWSYLNSYGTPGFSFLVELGYWENDEWLVMAASLAMSYEDLVQGGWTTDNLQNYPRQGPWSPGFAVPEPSGGLLLLFGTSLLALRRRLIGHEG